jgi:hypothetical protein
MPPGNPEEPAIVVAKAYDLVLWLLPKAETFSRSYRFSVGERVVSHALDLLLALVEAAYTANKAGLLQQANTKVNGLRYLLRLAKDLPLTTSHQPPATAPKVPHGGRPAKVGGEAIVKRVGGLWPQLISFANLLLAARRAAAGKRTRPDVAAFLLDLEPQLVRLQCELRDGSYTPGPYRCFPIRDPKPRLISAAPFRDRVVHHALTQVLEPVFEGGADLQVCAGPPGPAPAQSRRAPLPLRAEVRCAQVFPLHRPPDPQRPAGARRKVPPYARSGRPHR